LKSDLERLYQEIESGEWCGTSPPNEPRKKLILTTSANLAAFVDGPGQPKSRIVAALERLIFKSDAPETNDREAPF